MQTIKKFNIARFLLDDAPSVVLGSLLLSYDFSDAGVDEPETYSYSNSTDLGSSSSAVDVVMIVISTLYSLATLIYFLCKAIIDDGRARGAGLG